ncbi:uncharacterized protein J3R85_001309 [Psidium guajava]|nr:uncharacterized protein J3R85_001309 [Psidium guajava]
MESEADTSLIDAHNTEPIWCSLYNLLIAGIDKSIMHVSDRTSQLLTHHTG